MYAKDLLLSQAEIRQDQLNVNFKNDPSEDFAFPYSEDDKEDAEKSFGYVVKQESREVDIMKDEIATGNETMFKFLDNNVEVRTDNEIANRGLSDDDDDDYHPSNDDSDKDSEVAKPNKVNMLRPKKSLGKGRPPKPITDPKLCSLTRQRRVKHLRVAFKEWCVQLGCEVN